MQTTQLIMLVTMIACAAGIIIQDIFMAINKIPGDTFSELFARGLQNSLLFQVSLGVVLGHLCIHISQSQMEGSVLDEHERSGNAFIDCPSNGLTSLVRLDNRVFYLLEALSDHCNYWMYVGRIFYLAAKDVAIRRCHE